MHTVVIGGSGHIGTYLIPRLAAAGHDVTVVSRGLRSPYSPNPAWDKVRTVPLDRTAEEAGGSFGAAIRKLNPEILIDLTCYTLASACQLAEAVRGSIQLFAHCGTIWIHGHSTVVPTTEDTPRKPICEYGKQKLAIDNYLLDEAKRGNLPATTLHPGHIVGVGWEPLNPQGHFHPRVFSQFAKGEEISLPNFGMETVHHVHADDVAQAFEKAIAQAGNVIGEGFHVVSPAALTLRGYAEAMSEWFGRSPKLQFLPFSEWSTTVSQKEAAATWDHIAHSPNCSIAKARAVLHYEPGYSSLAAIQESVQDLIRRKIVAA